MLHPAARRDGFWWGLKDRQAVFPGGLVELLVKTGEKRGGGQLLADEQDRGQVNGIKAPQGVIL